MKQLMLVALLLPLTIQAQITTNSPEGEFKGLKWETGLSWDQIRAKAKAENKYIFVDVYTTWCGPCKMMDRNVYQHWRVGTEMNDKFVSVKVQMDTTVADNVEIKNWYRDAHQLMHDYKIDAFPTLLFFTPDATLVHSEQGYQNLAAFIHLTKLARDSKKPLYYGLYQEFKKGKKVDYQTLGELAIFTKNLVRDEIWANIMAKEYKENYLDKLSDAILCTQANYLFIGNFEHLMNSKDRFFALCYNQPSKVDSVRGKGIAAYLVNATILREEIERKVLKDGNAVFRMPDWKKIQSRIEKKYKRVDATRMVLDYQVNYYEGKYRDWGLWAKYKDERIKSYPPKTTSDSFWYAAGELNTFGAWPAFLICPEPAVLEKSIDWIDQALQLFPNNEAYLDTKANLLYKLGRRAEALKLEEKALQINLENAEKNKTEPDKWIKECIEKMKKGEPTWQQSQPSVQN